MISFIEHVPSGKTWTTEKPIMNKVDQIILRVCSGCLHFTDENDRMISLPPKIVKECIFEVYPDHKGD